MTLEEPYASIKSDWKAFEAIKSYELSFVSDAVVQASRDVWMICRACWHPDPESRPTTELILKCFRDWPSNAVCTVILSLHIAS